MQKEQKIENPAKANENFIPWIKRYTPKTSKEIVGQDEALSTLKKFVQAFGKYRNKAIILYGPTGSGKTSMVYAIANDLNLEMLEVNASDFRNKESINGSVGHASKQLSLFSRGKIILVDEIDGLSGMQDRGGIQALTDLIKTTSFPIVCTAADPFDKKFSNLRKISLLVELNALDYKVIANVLTQICKKEGIKHDDNDLKLLARVSSGDLRAAINDLQMLTEIDKQLKKQDIEDLAQRFKEESMESALLKIFKTTNPELAIKALENVDEDYDKAMLWIDENLPYEYRKPKDLAEAYGYLSKADVFKRRIRRWQHWRFLVYINAFITAGISVSKTEKYKESIKYKQTGRLLKLFIANMKFQKRKSIAEKIALKTHTSTRRVIQDTLAYLQEIFRRNRQESSRLAESLGLEQEEVDWLRK